MIFQDPMSSLNPRKKIRDIVAAGLDIRGDKMSDKERDERVGDALEMVGMAREHMDRYPGQFSGGQRQRVGIARALIVKPKLIIADECIAALDASVQAQVVNLIRKITEETGTSFLFISHDLSMVRYLSRRIGVLHLGYMLETGSVDDIYDDPIHPYTKSLLMVSPTPNPVVQRDKRAGYDYGSSGIIYENGTWHDADEGLSGSSAGTRALADGGTEDAPKQSKAGEKQISNGSGIPHLVRCTGEELERWRSHSV